jgi:hypothetical protein
MSASRFTTLPPELICHVFESAADLSVVACLAKTAPIFYHIWRKNPSSICLAVGPRVIANFTDAERLLDMQEQAEIVRRSDLPDWHEQRPINRAKRLLSNARWASAASDEWAVWFEGISECYYRADQRGEELGVPPSEVAQEDLHLRPREIARFEQAFYRVWTIGVTGQASHLRRRGSMFLDERSPRELFCLDEFTVWAESYNENDYGSVGLDFHDEVWKIGCSIVSDRWWTIQKTWPILAQPSGRDVPLGFFAFLDHTQIYLDPYEEAYPDIKRLEN